MKKVILHVGYQKSGSTFLQRKVFMNMINGRYLGYFPNKNIGNDIKTGNLNREQKELNSYHDCLTYKSNLGFMSVELEPFRIELENSDNNLLVFSNERFTDTGFTFLDIESKIKRCRQLFLGYDVHVIIVLRNQLEVLKSMYRERPFDPRCFEIGKAIGFNEWINIDRENGYKILEALKYDLIIDIISRYFNQVHVLNFNQLFNEDYLKEEVINKFGIKLLSHDLKTEEKINSGLNKLQFKLKTLKRNYFKDVRISSYIRKGIMSSLSKVSATKSVSLNPRNVDFLYQYYNEVNENILREYGIRLWDPKK